MYEGLIVHPTHRVERGRPIVQLYGRLSDGCAFLIEDDRPRPTFYVAESDREILASELDPRQEVQVDSCALRNLAGQPVVRVRLAIPSAVPPLRDRLAERGVPCFEADVRFAYRYLMDHDLRTAIRIEAEPARERDGLRLFVNPEVGPAASLRARGATHDARRLGGLRVLSIDIETTPDASRILSIALVGARAESVHIVSPHDVAGAWAHAEERELLIAAASQIRDFDPDVIVGWNVVDFDLRVIQARCNALGIPTPLISLGRSPGAVEIQGDRGFTRQQRARIPGRMVVDGIALVRDALRLEDYRLETVAHAVLGRGKRIAKDVASPAEEIMRLHREEPDAFVAYNLEDARLAQEILEREGLLELTLERSLLTGMQLDRVGASIASFDLLYLPRLNRRGYVAPSVDPAREHAPVRGGAVLDSLPGVHDHVAVYDFKSLYPSLMRTFNLDPLALAAGAREEDALIAPNGARLSRSPAILPEILDHFMQRRETARQRGDRHASQAIKIMMNSMFGIFAAPHCRFFDPELANAITGFGQELLGWTREAFEAAGPRVIYGDTDSVFVLLDLPRDASSEQAEQAADALRVRVAEEIARRIESEYSVTSRLELELEKVYSRLYLPRVRGGEGGSKKRYAGWIDREERLEIVGLEAIRRDWPAIAGRFQSGMLRRLFNDEPLLSFVREVIEEVLAGACDDELVYAKRIRKRSLERYTHSSPPHVRAALALRARTGREPGPTIHYVITPTGPWPIEDDGRLPADIDRKHYVEHVLRPLAEGILHEQGNSFDEALGEPVQLDLI